MTDKQKKDLIRQSLYMRAEVFDALPQEMREFLTMSWCDLDEHDRDLYFEVWAENPGTLEHAVMNAPCTAGEIQAAADVLRAIWQQWDTDGGMENDKNELTAAALMDAINRRAKLCK